MVNTHYINVHLHTLQSQLLPSQMPSILLRIHIRDLVKLLVVIVGGCPRSRQVYVQVYHMGGTDRCKKVLCGTICGTCSPMCCHATRYQFPQAVIKLGLQAVLSLHGSISEDLTVLGGYTASVGSSFVHSG